MSEQRNFILAIALSIFVIIGWQVFFGIPQMEDQRARQAALEEQQTSEQATGGSSPPSVAPTPGAASQPGSPVAGPGAGPGAGLIPSPNPQPNDTVRDDALAAAPRIAIETPKLKGSLSLRGATLDDLKLYGYHETVSTESPLVTLLSPTGSANPFYVQHGWTAAPDAATPVPTSDTVWKLETGSTLGPGNPISLAWDNGQGVVFRRHYAVDDRYMFTVTQTVENQTGEPVTLYPYALVSRHGTPKIAGLYILHEGLVGVLGEDGLQEIDYDDLTDGALPKTFTATGGWVGITDKYWAAVIVPDQTRSYKARFTAIGTTPVYQTDYLADAITVAPRGSTVTVSHVFAGAKQVEVVDGYEAQYEISNFDLLIDWGWFYFITKPMFLLIDWLFGLTGNFGVAILAATVLIKLVFFPLANKSYVSMSKMKLLQPEMLKIRERHKEDRLKQQQAMMALYKQQKVNPMSGCLPIIIQIPVFFALYKVLFVTIEMHHQPFFGWIVDLSAKDPTSLFNLFGLIPWDPPSLLVIGVWPLVMGFTMFIQMRLNPLPPDPIQQQIFTWMPVVFTVMLAQFAAGLVIYWAWNNSLSVLQQYLIMRRLGVKIELWDNIIQIIRPKPPAPKND